MLLPQLSASEPTTTTVAPVVAPTPAPAVTTSEPFNCESQGLWSMAKKNYCCKNYGVGCPTTPPPKPPPRPAPTQPPPPPAQPTKPPLPNCALGVPASWQMGKKVWCCLHNHIGCPTTPAPPPPPPIMRPPPAPPPIVRPPPPPAVRPPPPPAVAPPPAAPVGTTSCPYDCNAGYSNWEKGWPPGKKTYCCQTAHKGCPPAAAAAVTTSLPYDCDAGYHDCYQCLLKHWSVGKLAWCCSHTGRGCPTTAAPR